MDQNLTESWPVLKSTIIKLSYWAQESMRVLCDVLRVSSAKIWELKAEIPEFMRSAPD